MRKTSVLLVAAILLAVLFTPFFHAAHAGFDEACPACVFTAGSTAVTPASTFLATPGFCCLAAVFSPAPLRFCAVPAADIRGPPVV